MARSSRTIASVPRQAARDVYLLVCEGRQTEPGYFAHVRTLYGLTNLHIRAGDSATDYQSVLRRTEQLCRETEVCDYAYAVCDGDAIRGLPIEPEKRVRTVTSRNYAIQRSAITLPCIEYWLLLHFEYSDSIMNCREVESRLMRRHWPTYAKRSDIFGFLEKEHIERARANARQLTRSGVTDMRADIGALLDQILR